MLTNPEQGSALPTYPYFYNGKPVGSASRQNKVIDCRISGTNLASIVPSCSQVNHNWESSAMPNVMLGQRIPYANPEFLKHVCKFFGNYVFCHDLENYKPK